MAVERETVERAVIEEGVRISEVGAQRDCGAAIAAVDVERSDRHIGRVQGKRSAAQKQGAGAAERSTQRVRTTKIQPKRVVRADAQRARIRELRIQAAGDRTG